jgi:hypothetical protein
MPHSENHDSKLGHYPISRVVDSETASAKILKQKVGAAGDLREFCLGQPNSFKRSSSVASFRSTTSASIACNVPVLIGLWFGMVIECAGGPSFRIRIWLPFWRTVW